MCANVFYICSVTESVAFLQFLESSRPPHRVSCLYLSVPSFYYTRPFGGPTIGSVDDLLLAGVSPRVSRRRRCESNSPTVIVARKLSSVLIDDSPSTNARYGSEISHRLREVLGELFARVINRLFVGGKLAWS